MQLTALPISKSPGDDSFGALLGRGIAWLLVQLTPIALLLLRVPLWARGPQPREAFTPIILLTCQMFGAAILSPWLVRRRGLFIFLVGTATVFQLLATIAAEGTLTPWLTHSAIIVVWLGLITILAKRISSPHLLAACYAIAAISALLTPFLAPI